jgi:ribonuclease-3
VSGGPDAGRHPLEDLLEHRFDDRGLLETALVHASLANERGEGRGNERLEFLGDAVVGLVVAEMLYLTHPSWTEGELTRARAALVNKQALAGWARVLDLGRFIQLGRTERQSGGGEKDTILADGFEAVVGAVYLDAGFEPVERLIERLVGDDRGAGAGLDPKTAFQEWAHAEHQVTPRYCTTGDSEQEDDDDRFTVEVRIGGRVWGRGVGRSKRQAERRAAGDALAQVADGG